MPATRKGEGGRGNGFERTVPRILHSNYRGDLRPEDNRPGDSDMMSAVLTALKAVPAMSREKCTDGRGGGS